MRIGVKIKEFGFNKFGPEHGWLKKFAEAMGMSSPTLHQYLGENARHDPGAAILAKLHSLGCDLNWLFKEEISVVRDNNATYSAANPLKEENKRLKAENAKLKSVIATITKNIKEVQ